MVRNKKGWMRILEATLAVLLVTSVMVIVYTRQPDRSIDSGEFVYLMQREILNEISLNTTMRRSVLLSGGVVPVEIEDFISSQVPEGFGAKLKICDADLTIQPSCKLELSDFSVAQDYYDTLQKDLFVEETILSSDLDNYFPKRVRIFIWEN